MAKLTRHEQGLTVETFYGINRKTFEVDRISLTRGGVLRKYNREMQVYEHPIYHGRSPHDEIVIVFELTDIISFREGIFSQEQVRESIAQLGKKAAEIKERADKQTDSG